MRYLLATILILTAIFFAPVQAREYYLSSGGDDSNAGTLEQPWKSIGKLNEQDFQAGDIIYFERGSKFSGGLLIKDSGKPGNPIIFTAYGKGKSPLLVNRNHAVLNGNVIQVRGSHIIIDGFYFHDGVPADPEKNVNARQVGAVFITPGADHNTIKNCEFENCPVGIQVYGQYSLITRNFIHDCNMFLRYPYWGPVGIMVATSNHEISYNKIINYFAKGGAFGADGGAIEIDNSEFANDNIKIHHNYSAGNEGFLEIIGETPSTDNIQVSYNVSDDYQQFIFFWSGTNCIVENNTVLCLEPSNSRVRVVFSFAEEGEVTVRNNIFVLANGLQVFAGDSVYAATKWNQPHYNNLYYVVDGSQEDPCGEPPGNGDIIGDPLFFDLENRDLHLRAGSPAVDSGIDVGRSLDFEDKLVPAGNAPDMGAYEYQPN
jgi:hypothetical protein